jgi:hypothetical protein
MPRTINRAVLVVRPKQPYLDWAMALDDGAEDALSLREHFSVYLVAEDPEGRKESAPVRRYFRRIFERELELWYTDESAWPAKRDFKTFLTWFDVQAESMICDLEDTPIHSVEW